MKGGVRRSGNNNLAVAELKRPPRTPEQPATSRTAIKAARPPSEPAIPALADWDAAHRVWLNHVVLIAALTS